MIYTLLYAQPAACLLLKTSHQPGCPFSLQVAEIERFSSRMEDARFAKELLEAQEGDASEQEDIITEALAYLHQLDGQLGKWEMRRRVGR